MPREMDAIPISAATEPSPTAAPSPVPIAAAPLTPEPPPITPAPVTEEEIAALLESALTPHPLRDIESPDQPAGDASPLSSQPRRRNLPRRSEAA